MASGAGAVTCHFGDGIVVCDGQSGGWRVTHVLCPWCCVQGAEPVRALSVLIFGGYGGSDYICGSCGQNWASADEVYLRKVTNEERETNIAKVAARADPKCWDCHDTGDVGMPGFDVEPMPCKCGVSA